MAPDGSVRTAGNRVRVTAQLIDAKSGFQVWSESWERTLSDVFQIQNEIAEAATRALTSSSIVTPPQRTAVDPRAYELYLRAKPLQGDNTPDALEHCQRLLTKALEIDLTFADAWSFLGTLMVNKANCSHFLVAKMVLLAIQLLLIQAALVTTKVS